MNIFINVQELCKSSGISILSLEKSIGLHDNTIGKWKTSVPNIASVIKVADYFNMSLDTLVGRTVEQPAITNGNGIVGNNNAMTNSNNFSPNNEFDNLSDIEKALLEVSKGLTVMQKIDVINYAREIKKL